MAKNIFLVLFSKKKKRSIELAKLNFWMVCFLLQERKKKILEHSNVLAKSVNGHTLFKEGLLDEVIDVFSFGEI